MSKPIHHPSSPPPSAGFTLIELVLAMALSLLVFALVFALAQQLGNTADYVGSVSDVNENLRAAVNMVSRDLSQAGQNIPVSGIPIPNGGTATVIKRPGPSGTPAFPAATTNITVLTPGYQLGPTQPTAGGANALSTDIVTIIGVNQSSQFNQTAVTANPTVSSGQVQITVSTTAAGYVAAGQLIMLTNSNASCLLAISSVNTSTGVITCNHPDATNDPLGVNQFSGPNSGTINQLQSAGGSWPAITAYPVTMVTYYLDTSTTRRLMKQIVMGTAQPVALGIYVMTISYSCSPLATPTDPTRNPASPNTIRKVILTMIGESDHQNHANGQWYTRSITNALTVQNLDYYNKYNLGAHMTQN